MTSGFADRFRKTNIYSIINATISAVTLPGDVFTGKVDPNSDEALRRTVDLAGMVTLGAGAVPARGMSILRAGSGKTLGVGNAKARSAANIISKQQLKPLAMDKASRMARAKEMGFSHKNLAG